MDGWQYYGGGLYVLLLSGKTIPAQTSNYMESEWPKKLLHYLIE